ncbi:integrase domain-containing protein [Alteromonas macleodii]|uniref:integrase domain-containing protein n=1 Tax=Alteromonas macleodii TaxID=28108 RepID=UPI000286CB66|nr:integrase domain-containing protein [Alteromonas macleodii]AFT94743.1 phage integrase [Alteromonas macleodii str. 'Balearic Sea AD45']MEE3221985.1 integrase domain-containing protein [Pseudomonadota bacterium]USI29979.1 integrase domain-containing protein [Alteromonas macleodii]
MARITKPLTNTEVQQAKPTDKEYILSDGEGLRLRVKPNGSKLWIFNYIKPATKKRANISFGVYPDLSLKEARIKRKEAREMLALDIDPAIHRAETKNKEKEEHENTLIHVAEQWFRVKKISISADYAQDIWRSLEKHIFPEIGKAPISRLRAPMVINVIRPIEAKGSLETVKRIIQRLNEIMIFAVNSGTIDSNPLAGIGKVFQAPQKQNMPSIPPSELPVFISKVANASIKLTTRCLIEWQLHTMVRPGEAAGTRWDEINFDSEIWSIPAGRMKKKRPHVVPLTKQALKLLEVMRPISGHREYVFPSDRNPKTHANPYSANVALKRMGFHKKLVAHGLRSIASTALNEHGFDPDIIESALAHVDRNQVRAAYNRTDYLERRKKMMAWWSSHIEEAGKGNLTLGGSSI